MVWAEGEIEFGVIGLALNVQPWAAGYWLPVAHAEESSPQTI